MILRKDYEDLKDAGFSEIELVEALENEYYETEEDNAEFVRRKKIEMDLFQEYVNRYKTDKGILLNRKLYGIVAKK